MKTVTVNAAALRQLLAACMGPGHHIRELQATMRLPDVMVGDPHPIKLLVREYNEALAKFKEESKDGPHS